MTNTDPTLPVVARRTEPRAPRPSEHARRAPVPVPPSAATASARHVAADWSTALSTWTADQAAVGVSAKVTGPRRAHLMHLAEHPATAGATPGTLTADQLDAYLGARSWTATTRANNVKSIRAFYRWATAAGHVGTDPAATVRVTLTPAEVAALNRHRRVYPEHITPGPAPRSVPASWHDLIAGWTDHARAAALSEHTVRSVTDHLYRLARDLDPTQPAQVTRADLEQWLAARTEWARETRRRARGAIRSLFRWAYDAGYLAGDPSAQLRVVRASTPVPRPASDRTYRDALAAADDRTALVLMLAAEMGLRRAEVAHVHSRDILDSADGFALLVHGKGDKPRIVPIPAHIHTAIRAQFTQNGPGWLLPSTTAGNHLTPRHLGVLAARVLPPGVGLHQLRHRFATAAYRGTGDLRSIQQLLGHSSVATTQRYIAIDHAALRGVVTAAGQVAP